MYMNPEDWLEVVRKEYLQDFVRGGGAAVKFIVPAEDIDHGELQQKLRSVAEAEGYLFALVDAAKTRVHMIDHVFHEVSRQVDWDELAFSFVSRLLPQNGFEIPSDRQEFNLRNIAGLNRRSDERRLQKKFDDLLEESIFRDYQMCQEFRIAMIRLCEAQLDPSTVSHVSSDVIKEWLRGKLRLISEIKPELIFQKVTRHNARHMLSSLSYWSHLAGKNGLVIVLDISRCLALRPKPRDLTDDTRYYTIATTLDAYEVLRQSIDATDDLEFCFLAVIAPPAFLHPDERRGVRRYDALYFRIWDEVRDKHRANPLSSLMRLSPWPEAVAATGSKEVMR